MGINVFDYHILIMIFQTTRCFCTICCIDIQFGMRIKVTIVIIWQYTQIHVRLFSLSPNSKVFGWRRIFHLRRILVCVRACVFHVLYWTYCFCHFVFTNRTLLLLAFFCSDPRFIYLVARQREYYDLIVCKYTHIISFYCFWLILVFVISVCYVVMQSMPSLLVDFFFVKCI